MRKIILGMALIVVFLLLAYAYLIWENNKIVTIPNQADLQTTLEKAIVWLDRNREIILSVSNPPLWRMVQQAAELTGDERLKSLFAAYNHRYLENRNNDVWRVWRHLFYPGTRVPVRFEDITRLPYYDWHFIYASLCDRKLGNNPEIAAQNNPAFCDKHPISPACEARQLMGIRLLQRSDCGDAEQLADTVRQLEQRIRRQLVLDPRVVDVYMQRVLMLMESGAREFVKPIWIKRLVDAQRTDGGWASFYPLMPLLIGDRYFGYGPKYFALKKQPHSDFHMTAQGVLLFSILTNTQDSISLH
jgi:hypothetical protein